MSGSSVVLGSLGAYDLQSLVAEGSRATLSNSDNIELAIDIYSKYAKSNSVKHSRTWISYFTRARPPSIQTFPIASSAHDSATSVLQGSSHLPRTFIGLQAFQAPISMIAHLRFEISLQLRVQMFYASILMSLAMISIV